MKIQIISISLLALFLISCHKKTSSKEEDNLSEVYQVKLMDDHISFKGIDHPQISADLPDDQYEEETALRPRHNISRHRRCVAVVESALAELSSLAAAADTRCLLKSLRYGAKGEIDHYLARDGNWLILTELAKRRPLPADVRSEYGGKPMGIFRGPSAVGTFNLDELLLWAATRNEAKNGMRTGAQQTTPNH